MMLRIPLPRKLTTVEMPAEPQFEAHDPAEPRLWQLWQPFVGIHRWYFSRGCPPPLRNLEGPTACVHATVLCATMGLAAAAIGFSLEDLGGRLQYQWSKCFQLLPGLVFGFVVLLPISRWLGRLWWLIACSLFAATLGFGPAESWTFDILQSAFGDTAWLFTWMWEIAALSASLTMVGRNRSTIRIPIVACAGACLAGIVHQVIWIVDDYDNILLWPMDVPIYYLPDVVLMVAVSVAVGMRLWPFARLNSSSARVLSDRKC